MLMMTNPDRPAEVSELERAMYALYQCKSGGRWDLGALDKWLKLYPDQMAAAIDTLGSVLDGFYPPLEVPNEQHAV
ncbi:hypothetical protein ACFSR7_12450 [Cohnella sp. GCM10020058]|uniref:hypothetical protein n=1 Tax=Cohnella sp. GCM10020058 TaxID=3317330 RepID=UPI003627978B